MKKVDYVGRRFQLSQRVNELQIPVTAIVLEAYGTLVLCEEQRAASSGRYKTLNIYNVKRNGEGREFLSPYHTDYGSGDYRDVPKYSAKPDVVRRRFAEIIAKLKVENQNK